MPTPDGLAIDQLLALIESTWGYRDLAPLQHPAMTAFLERRDSLVVLPTGGGKSLCYQAPALLSSLHGRGPTVVISPLIALMKDQVDALRSLGVAAAQLDSSLSSDQRRQVAADLRAGQLHLLYLSPERLVGGGDGLHELLRDASVQTFAVDEAHCISHWGHDFRPEYRQLAHLKTLFPGAAVHAYTATATCQVRDDIARQLQLHSPEVLVGNFDRPNLTYRILPRRDLYKQIDEVLDRHPDEAGIIYCLRRKDVDDVSHALAAAKGPAAPRRKVLGYHAGMTPDQRKRVQDAFIKEDCDVIVATVAFGMGIDRSNIRFVLHAGMPKSIEAYQQETGRAGRDGLEAECVLLYSGQDPVTWKRLVEMSAKEAANAGAVIAADFVASASKHIDDMDRFARSATCRHRALVEYFGQKYDPPTPSEQSSEEPSDATLTTDHRQLTTGCGACDHCLGDTNILPDGAIIAQKILSAIARTDQRFGVSHIVALLRGAKTDRVRQLGHDQLPTYGLLASYAEAELRDFIYQLIGQGALAQENFELANGRAASILKLNHASVAILKGRRTVRLVQIVRKSAAEARQTRGAQLSWGGVDHALFEALRGLRKEIAYERAVPPYVVFSDATLRELARVRPTTAANFRRIYGIGENKLKTFGPQFVAFITEHCRAAGLSTDQTRPRPSLLNPRLRARRAALTASRAQAFAMFRHGASIEDAAQKMGRAPSTIEQYLVEYITAERPASLAPWVPDPAFQQIEEASQKLETDRLKPIFLELGEQIPYPQIRAALALLRIRETSRPGNP